MRTKLLVLLFLFTSGLLTIKAQTTGVVSGAMYKLRCVASAKLLNVSNASMANSANVDTWTDTGSDAERWIVTHVGSSIYTFQNVATGKYLHLSSATPANLVNVDQYDNTNDNAVKWLIVNNGDASFTLQSAGNTTFALDVNAGASADGTNVQLWQNNGFTPQKWTFETVTAQAVAPTAAIADQVFDAWKVKFNIVNDNGFWGTAEMMEIALDAFEVTGQVKYRDMYNQMYSNFITREGSDWMWNNFNDDITWMAISCVRSYLLTGNTIHLAKGKEQFDKMYARANTHQFGGDGLIWQQGVTGTNSCINGPAMVCCAYLAQATGDMSYYTKAIAIYNWSKLYLLNATTGKVNDNYNGTTVGTWSSTYNQGTYLGASVMLYNYSKDASYLTIANNIASFTKNDMFGSNTMNNEEGGGDLPGFKGIFMRYARRYVVDCNKADYIPWLQLNAKTAYNNRNSQNVITTQWGVRSPETIACNAFSASTAASLMINCPLSTTLVKSAFATIEAESFNYLKGVMVESCGDTGGGSSLGGVMPDYYTAYNNIDFGTKGATSAQFRVASATAGGTIEIRLGGLSGTLIGTATVTGTGGWSTWATVTCQILNTKGLQNVYLIYKGSSYLYNLNNFKFIEDATVAGTGDGLTAYYYNGMNFDTSVSTRKDATINFDWASGSPLTGVNADVFSVRWRGLIQPRYTGTYAFYLNSDNGRRLWINNVLVIDKWLDDAGTEYSGTIALTAGQKYDIKIEYFENAGAANCKLAWSSVNQPREIIPQSQLYSTIAAGNGLTGAYFNGMNFETAVTSRIDANINFDWGTGSPATGVNADAYSARWTGLIVPKYSQTYTFYVNSDNGRRLWINNQLIVDKWVSDWGTVYSGTITLVAGFKYDIKLEYFEDYGGANCKLEWASTSQVREIVPQSQLFSSSAMKSRKLSTEIASAEVVAAIFPNPLVNRVMNVELTGLSQNEHALLAIFDLNGKQVLQTKMANSGTVNVSGIAAGAYFVRISTNTTCINKKIIVR